MINCLTLTDEDFDQMEHVAFRVQEIAHGHWQDQDFLHDVQQHVASLANICTDLIDVVRSQNALLQKLAERAAIDN